MEPGDGREEDGFSSRDLAIEQRELLFTELDEMDEIERLKEAREDELISMEIL